MRICIAGATGYIGSKLVLELSQEGHQIIPLIRDKSRIPPAIVCDLMRPLPSLPQDIDVAYYLVHSMKESSGDFYQKEEMCARNFLSALKKTACKQIIFLSGLCQNGPSSEHLRSRQNVESIFRSSSIPSTILRAGIVIGEGSLSFEIMRDLVEKLPIMITPRWIKSLCQPIAISDLLFYLKSISQLPAAYNKTFEIGGPDILSYKEMLLGLARERDLKRLLIPVPVFSPLLSSYWLAFITKVNFRIAQALVESLRTNAISSEHSIETILPHICLSYKHSLVKALSSSSPPSYGVFTIKISTLSDKKTLPPIEPLLYSWGGNSLFNIKPFSWRPLKKKSLCYTSRCRFGEAWLEWNLENGLLEQNFTYRPKGVLGRFFWYLLFPMKKRVLSHLLKEVSK